MMNVVHIEAILAFKGDGYCILDCDGVFIRCYGAELSDFPLASFLDIHGSLQNADMYGLSQLMVEVSKCTILPNTFS